MSASQRGANRPKARATAWRLDDVGMEGPRRAGSSWSRPIVLLVSAPRDRGAARLPRRARSNFRAKLGVRPAPARPWFNASVDDATLSAELLDEHPRWLARRQFAAWSIGSDLIGWVLWGHVGDDDAEAMKQLWLELAHRIARPYDFVLDLR